MAASKPGASRGASTGRISIAAAAVLLCAVGSRFLESREPHIGVDLASREEASTAGVPGLKRSGPVAAASLLNHPSAGMTALQDSTPDSSPVGTWAGLEGQAPEDLVAQALSGQTAPERAAAVAALPYAVPGDFGNEDYVATVLVQALMDPEVRVRAQALAALKDTAEVLPTEAVAQVMRDDPSPDLRIQALELLVERTGEQAREPLRLALADPESAVRERAGELIEDWHLSLEGE